MASVSHTKRLSMIPSKYLAFLAFFASFCYLIICPFLRLSSWFSVFPFVLMATKGIDVTVTNGLFLSMIWMTYTLVLVSPLYFIIGRFTLLFIYMPILGVVFYKEPHEEATWFFLTVEYLFWDIPLLFWVRLISRLGGRALKPFHSQITPTVAVGSIPLAIDVDTLKHVHGIGIVVNMCVEYSGPVSEYIVHGIRHIHVPTPDVCEPQYYDILLGLRQIVQFAKDIAKQKGLPNINSASSSVVTADNVDLNTAVVRRSKRMHSTTANDATDAEDSNVSDGDRSNTSQTATTAVDTADTAINDDGDVKLFIHCKAGRGRATTFALCYLIFKGHDPENAMRLLKQKRHVVETYVLHFQCVTQFVRNFKLYLGDLELMIAAEEKRSGLQIL